MIKISVGLPVKLVKEIGYLATDWAMVEQNLLAHTVVLSDGDTTNIPTGFTRLRRHWLRLCRPLTAVEHHADLEALNDRLARRALARNYGLHGIWRRLGEDLYLVEFLQRDSAQGNTFSRVKIETTFEEFKNQTKLMRELRRDFLEFLARHHPPSERRV